MLSQNTDNPIRYSQILTNARYRAASAIVTKPTGLLRALAGVSAS